ncbi:MAG: inorganic phosphate transporter [Anaerolineales bacterium]|nr:inorganic phosphate transporter [Anaerolineales bacterium]
MLISLIVLSLFYAFLNGYRDSSSILAGVIASRAMNPRIALYFIGVADLIAPFLFGLAVARSIATGLIDTSAVELSAITLGMASAVIWSLFSWWRGIPSSSTHAMIGGLLGAALIMHGPKTILTSGLLNIILPLLLAPVVAFILSLLLMKFFYVIFYSATPKINVLFQHSQIVTMVLLALANSSNDAQKSMGAIALGLVLAGRMPSFAVPSWVLISCTVALALGGSIGDWRQIRNLGGRIYRIRPMNALDSQVTSIALISVASILGIPVSTPHIISSAIVGSGVAERINKIRWRVVSEMVTSWLVTIPATGIFSCLIYFAVMEFLKISTIF